MSYPEFHYPTRQSPTISWLPSLGHQPGAEPVTDYPNQIVQETAGNTLRIQEKGIKRQTYTLQFVGLSKADKDSLQIFFETIKKSLNSFEFIDRDGQSHTVHWMNAFEFPTIGMDGLHYSGEIVLRKV